MTTTEGIIEPGTVHTFDTSQRIALLAGVQWDPGTTPLVQIHIPVHYTEDALILLRLCAHDGTTPLVDILADGTAQFGATYTPDEATRAFWEAFSSLAPEFVHTVPDTPAEP